MIPPTKSLVVSALHEIKIAGGIIEEEVDKPGPDLTALLSSAIDMLLSNPENHRERGERRGRLVFLQVLVLTSDS